MDRKRKHGTENPCNKRNSFLCVGYLMLFLIFALLSTNSYAFTFDKWHSGQSINSICIAASQRNQNLYEKETGLGGDGIVDVAGRFINDAVNCRDLKGKTTLYYAKSIFGKPCIVSLQFTPRSRKLKSITIKWAEFSLKRLKERSYNKEYLHKVLGALQEKYGNPKSVETATKTLFENASWIWDISIDTEPGDLITLDGTVKEIVLKYTDERNVDLAEYEKRLIEYEKEQLKIRREILDKSVF